MDIERIYQEILKCGFSSLEVNVSHLKVGYRVTDKEVYVVAIFAYHADEVLLEQYKNITRQIQENFRKHYEKEVELLSIICSNQIALVRSYFASLSRVWMVDTISYRLLIYENQISNFMELREVVEDILYSIKEESVSNSVQDEDKKEFRFKYFFKVNMVLILINVFVFLFVNVKGNDIYSRFITNEGGLYWRACFYDHEYYRLLTYMFLHSGFNHLANNMFLLFVLGSNVEMMLGRLKYTLLYLLSGVTAGIGSITYNRLLNNNVISVGASGAIFGVVGGMVYFVIAYKGRIKNISKRQMILFVIFSLYGGFTSSRIDNVAHVVGLVAGVLFAAILDRIGKNKLEREITR